MSHPKSLAETLRQVTAALPSVTGLLDPGLAEMRALLTRDALLHPCTNAEEMTQRIRGPREPMAYRGGMYTVGLAVLSSAPTDGARWYGVVARLASQRGDVFASLHVLPKAEETLLALGRALLAGLGQSDQEQIIRGERAVHVIRPLTKPEWQFLAEVHGWGCH